MPSREQVAEVLNAHPLECGPNCIPCGRVRVQLLDALMPLFEQVRNEALEEAAALVDKCAWDAGILEPATESWEAAQIRARKTGGGGSSG